MKRKELDPTILAGIVLGVMKSTGTITEEQYRKLKAAPIPVPAAEEKGTAE